MRPKKYGCHGQFVVMHGTSLTSAWSATGLVVSGVADARIRSTLSPRMSSDATSEARLPLDWLSLLMICTGNCLPPTVSPFAQNSARLFEDEAVGLAETGERAGARADVPDLDRAALGIGGNRPQHGRSGDRAQARGHHRAS